MLTRFMSVSVHESNKIFDAESLGACNNDGSSQLIDDFCNFPSMCRTGRCSLGPSKSIDRTVRTVELDRQRRVAQKDSRRFHCGPSSRNGGTRNRMAGDKPPQIPSVFIQFSTQRSDQLCRRGPQNFMSLRS